ncbi:MAG TPA: adenylate/guanylate cyclase domain-containing protein [Methylomirabilota bacterium]|nr:adenylate/guanylate cyclase domain-containing protein [Methylomirabilota bacterium]
MNCPRCQHENRQEARFCEECAAPLARICANCRTALSATAKFCHACAHPVSSAVGTQSRAPDSYTPRNLAEKILTSRAALEGERKQVTVLFADLMGSMELLADRDPEEARKLLDPVIEQMMEAVHRYEGTVNQVMGDGVMALFGAPLAHEDHAVRACYAALRMQDGVRRYSEDLRRAQGVEVQIRIGLNSGEVLVRSIGSDLRMDYTAVGQTTHLAARMEQLATPGTVRLTGETLRLAEGYVEVRSLGPIPVKGLTDPVEIFELTGAGQARTRLQAAALRGLTRFVGRDAEVEHLRRVLGQAAAGHGQVAAIVGEAGVGKSRLVYEFTHSHRVGDWLILEASSVSYGKAASYMPVIDLLRGYFKIGDRDDHREIRARVLGRVLALDRALEPLLPPLLALLEVPVEDAVWQTLDPGQRRQRTLDAVKRLLLRESQAQPLLLVFEDLHWVDGETQALLDSLVDSLGSARLLLLVNYRPEYQHGWGSKTAYSQMRLDTLALESAGDLLEALLGDDPGLGPLKQLLVKRGNPFFLEETVRTLVETKALEGSRGRYRLTQPLHALQVPSTVQTILAARIDRLSPDDKRLLQTASVVGKDVPFTLLQAIAGLPDEALREGLDRLQAAEFLYETGLFPDPEYTFKHALTHEVTYGSLLQERRRMLHAQLVAALETLRPDRLGEQIERLAHHALRGEVWEKAIVYLRQAGLRAMARGANAEAIAQLELALGSLRHIPETREKTELTIDIRLDLRNANLPLGDRTRMGEHLHEAELLARALGDRRRLARIATFMVIQCVGTGDYDEAVRFGKEALGIAQTLQDRPIEVVATSFLGMTHAVRGELREAVVLLSRNAALEGDLRYERFGAPVIQSALSAAVLADVLSELGRFEEAIGYGEAALLIGETTDHPFTLYWGLFGLGLACFRRGDLPRATRLLERCLDLCRTGQILTGLSPVAAALGVTYAFAGRLDEAVSLVAGAVEGFHSRQTYRWATLILTSATSAYLRAGRLEEAAARAAEALAVARRLGARGAEAHALAVAGEIAAAAKAQNADALFREALTLAQELGMRPLVAHCHLGLGKLHRRAEDLTAATTMYRQMGMRYWLEKAEAETRDLA